jgi:sensor histidine kinase YesM
MKKSLSEVSINILFWLLTAWLLTTTFSIEVKEIEVINGIETVYIQHNKGLILHILLIIFVSLIMFYSTLYIILKLKTEKNKLKIIIWSLLTFLISIIIVFSLSRFSSNPGITVLPQSTIWGTLSFYYAIATTYGLAKVWLHIDNQRQKLLLEKKQAELSLLRSKLHPHFLFNTLNNLLSMVEQQKNPNLANALNKLSRLLRYVVYDTAMGKVPISKEIDFIRNFCDLIKLRFEKEEIQFELEVKGKYYHQLIEPGIFIPFIENAFKYGTEPEKISKIFTTFDLSNESKIVFRTSNQIYSSMQNSDGKGSGIQSTAERLKLVYPKKHTLNIFQNSHFIVELEIQTI